MNLFTLLALCALAPALAAQPYFQATTGHSVAEHTIPNPPSSTFIGGAAFDPTGQDLYYWDGTNIRRFDTTLNQPAPTPLFTVPVSFGPYIDVMKFDPATPTDLIVSDSGAFKIYRLRRAGPDTLSSQASGTVNLYVYDIAFDATGRMFASASDATTFQCGIYLIDPATLTERLLIDISLINQNGSGPLCFDAAGNLYSAIPPAFGQQGPGQIMRFNKSVLDAAIATLPPTPGPAPLNDTDGSLVIGASDNFAGMGRMQFRIEDGQEFLYYTTSAGTDVRRAQLALKQDTLFLDGAAPQSGLNNFTGALAFDGGASFAPYGGGSQRLAVICGAQNSSFAIVNHAITIIRPQPVVTGVSSLAFTSLPAFVRNGVPFSLTVEVRNSGGTPIAGGAAVRITATSPAGGALLGFVTVADVGGVIDLAGLIFSAPDASLPSTVQFSAALVGVGAVTPVQSGALPAYALLGNASFSVVPASVAKDTTFSVTVQVRDNTGQAVVAGPDASASITLSVYIGPGFLTGTTTVAAVNGIAVFNNLRLDESGDYVLRASATGLNAGLSNAINVPIAKGTAGDGGCSTAEDSMPALAGLFALLATALALRHRRARA